MTASACDYCTGTHYLSDTPGLGACVCCTPEALQRAEALLSKREATIAAMSERKTLAELLDELEGIASDTRTRLAELEAEAEEREATLAEAEPALQAYLVSLGMAATPVARPDGPLGDLCRALGVCE